MIMRWRDYLGKNLDYRPEQILPNRHLTALARAFHGNEATTAQDMAELLREYEVPDKFYQSAKLLLAYLDRSGESLQKMRDVICRSCNQTGHVVKIQNYNKFESKHSLQYFILIIKSLISRLNSATCPRTHSYTRSL